MTFTIFLCLFVPYQVSFTEQDKLGYLFGCKYSAHINACTIPLKLLREYYSPENNSYFSSFHRVLLDSVYFLFISFLEGNQSGVEVRSIADCGEFMCFFSVDASAYWPHYSPLASCVCAGKCGAERT